MIDLVLNFIDEVRSCRDVDVPTTDQTLDAAKQYLGGEGEVVDGFIVLDLGPHGLYLKRADQSRGRQGVQDVVVEVPHPFFDIHTWRLGWEVFSHSRARAFFLAGAHRSLLDVAHTPLSIFQAIHVTEVARGDVVYQPHGFTEDAFPDDLDPLIVNGFTRDYFVPSLAGRTNVQGRATRAVGARFIHVEHARWVREDEDVLASVAHKTASFLMEMAGGDTTPRSPPTPMVDQM